MKQVMNSFVVPNLFLNWWWLSKKAEKKKIHKKKPEIIIILEIKNICIFLNISLNAGDS